MSARKSDFEHQLSGTKARVTGSSESYVAGSLPRPPKHLSADAKKKFRALVRQLSDRRAVTAGDGDLISIYCTQDERWQQALTKIREQGVVVVYQRIGADGLSVDVEKPNLHLAVAKDCERSMVVILTRLGLTPKDRETVKPTSPAKPKKEVIDPDSNAGRIAAMMERPPAPPEPEPEMTAEEAARINAAMESL